MNVNLSRFLLCFALVCGSVTARTQTPASPADVSSPSSPTRDDSDSSAVVAPTPIPSAPPESPQTLAPVASPAAPETPSNLKPQAPKLRARTPVAAPTAPAAERDDDDGDNVSMGDVHLEPGQSAHSVVSILGNSLAESPVQGAVVAVLGNSEAREEVADAVVAVLGNAYAHKEVGDSVVAVLGNARADGHVNGTVVAVLGNVELGPDAVIDGDVVAIGGTLERDPQAVVHGHVTILPFLGGGHHLDGGLNWVHRAVFRARLLAFGPGLIWSWIVALVFLVAYVLLGLAFSTGITRCAETLEQRPGWTILATLLTAILAPVLVILLLVTVFGAFFLCLALMVGAIFGKAAFLAWIGRRTGHVPGPLGTALSVLIGGIIILLLFTVPLIGLFVWAFGSALGLGMVIYTLILSMRREKLPKPPSLVGTADARVVAGVSPSSVTPPAAAPTQVAAVPFIAPATHLGTASPENAILPTSIPPLPPTPPPVNIPGGLGGPTVAPAPDKAILPPVFAATLPRVGFGLRLAAALLDVVLVCMLAKLLHLTGWFFLLYTAYCVSLWATKATTVGGIICGLKIVRLDDRPIDWSIALIRALGAFLSGVVFGLGFLWVLFDDQGQSWHDKIAGTTIVRVPKGVSLI